MKLILNEIESYVVHLKKRKDREENMIKELNSFINKWEVFDAIKMNPGYKGTSESFKTIIRKAKEKGLEQVLIFEDDVRFTSKKSKEKFQKAIDSLPEKWDILLGGVYTLSKPRKIEELKFNEHLLKIGDFSSLHCILINKSCYDKILEHKPNEVKHLDRYLGKLSRENKINAYLAYPMVAIQYNTYSDNVNKHVNYNKLLDKFELFDFEVKRGRRMY
jgi:GR25 family glycosyltransferase involved in LPS biosynthesis